MIKYYVGHFILTVSQVSYSKIIRKLTLWFPIWVIISYTCIYEYIFFFFIETWLNPYKKNSIKPSFNNRIWVNFYYNEMYL